MLVRCCQCSQWELCCGGVIGRGRVGLPCLSFVSVGIVDQLCWPVRLVLLVSSSGWQCWWVLLFSHVVQLWLWLMCLFALSLSSGCHHPNLLSGAVFPHVLLYLSICLSVCVCYVTVCVSPSVCLSVYFSVRDGLCDCLSVHWSFCLFVCIASLYLLVCLSVHVPVHIVLLYLSFVRLSFVRRACRYICRSTRLCVLCRCMCLSVRCVVVLVGLSVCMYCVPVCAICLSVCGCIDYAVMLMVVIVIVGGHVLSLL